MTNLFLVGLGGALGAMLRYGTYTAVGSGAQATVMVNLLGSLVFGLIMGWFTSRDLPGEAGYYLFFGVGLLGAFTTFSAFSRETVHFFMNGEVLRGAVFALVNLIGAVTAFAVGLFLVRRLLA